MKQLLSLSCILLLAAGSATGQLFSLVNTPMQPLSNSSTAWGDFDNDGDLDLALTGEPGSTIPATYIYRNNNGTLEAVATTVPGLSDGSAEWGDYDADGDLDLLLIGRNNLNTATSLIIDNDNGLFTDSGIDLPGVMSGQASWGDFDNDGDLDILMAGVHEGLTFYTMILRNEGNGQFIDHGEHFPGIQNASVAWVDYNNDGKPDVMIGGDSGAGMITRLYKQEEGSFKEVNPEGFIGLATGDLKWADLDNDGDMDLVLAGVDLYLDGFIMLYRNDGNDQFTPLYNLMNSLAYTSFDFADYNNDGWLDIIISGKIIGCGSTAVTILMRNESFLNFFEESTLIPGFKQGDVTWGDFNNDGFTDLIITGLDGFDVPKTQLYKSNSGSGIYTTNTPPEMPQGLAATTSGSNVTISWNRATDLQTPSGGLSYNLYIGTAQATPDVVAPNANPLTGIRHLAGLGNTSQDTGFTIANLEDGEYYWSVQAIDNGFMGSSFSPEQTFTINAVGIPKYESTLPVKVYPNPVRDILSVQVNEAWHGNSSAGLQGPDPASRIDIVDALGNTLKSLTVNGPVTRIDVSGLSPGLYVLHFHYGDQQCSSRFIKR